MSAKPSLFTELQRRHVYKVGAAYAVAGWLLVQIATQVFPFFEISNVAVRWVVILVLAGFPVALVLAWVFDFTPEGIVRTDDLPAGGESSAALRDRRSMDRKLSGLLGILLACSLGYVAFEHLRPAAGHAPADVAVRPDKGIAVLPFESLSDDKDNAYFASGIQDEILTKLAGIADLKVISRTSTEKYKSRPENLRAVAEELGVGTVLEGSVQRSGDRVRVNVQLIDARADAHLWADTYDRDMKDAFAVESEVSQHIADALAAKLSPREVTALATMPTRNAAAYDVFLKGEYLLARAIDTTRQADSRDAEAQYRQAIALDPGFALAHAKLAYCLMSQYWFDRSMTPEQLAEAGAIAERAVALAPDLAEAHLALGYFHYWGHLDYEPAKAEFRRMLDLQPNNAQGLGALAFIHRRQGEWPQALEMLAKAVSFAPRDSQLVNEYGQTFEVMRRYEDARAQLRRALVLDPDNLQASFFLSTVEGFGFGDAPAAARVYQSLPPDRLAPINHIGGDVLYVINGRAYPSMLQRRYDEALKIWDAAAGADPQAPAPTPGQSLARLSARVAIQTVAGQSRAIQSECTQLRERLEPEVARHAEDPSLLAPLAWADVCLGRNADAVRLARRGVDLTPVGKDAYNGNYYLDGLAQIDAHAGEPDEALKILAQLLAIPAGDTLSVARLKLDPVWDPLRGDPRFGKLIADFGGSTP